MGVTLLIADAADRWGVDIERELISRQQAVSHVHPKDVVESSSVAYQINAAASQGVSVPPTSKPGYVATDVPSAVLLRASLGDLTRHIDFFSEQDTNYARAEWAAALIGWLNSLSCPVINAPVPGRSRHLLPSHPVLRDALSAAGMSIGASVVVSSVESAVQRYDMWNRHVRAQILASGSAPADLRGAAGTMTLEDLVSQGSVTVQQISEGRRLCVVVAGPRVLGGCWRTAVQNGRLRESILDATTISPRLAQQCRHIAQQLTQPVAMLDLVLGHDETVSCLGVSDMPDYEVCSDHMRQLIVHHVSNLLDRTEEWHGCDSSFRAHSRSYCSQSVHAIGCEVR